MIYTSNQAIANRLRGRLAVGSPQLPFSNTVIDPALINQVGEQVEARVNAQLGQAYRLPLSLSDTGAKATLASVVEKLVICELMGTHYVGSEATSEDGYGRMMCKQGADELRLILAGAVALQGEAPVGVQPGITSNYSLTSFRTPGSAEAIDF